MLEELVGKESVDILPQQGWEVMQAVAPEAPLAVSVVFLLFAVECSDDPQPIMRVGRVSLIPSPPNCKGCGSASNALRSCGASCPVCVVLSSPRPRAHLMSPIYLSGRLQGRMWGFDWLGRGRG